MTVVERRHDRSHAVVSPSLVGSIDGSDVRTLHAHLLCKRIPLYFLVFVKVCPIHEPPQERCSRGGSSDVRWLECEVAHLHAPRVRVHECLGALHVVECGVKID